MEYDIIDSRRFQTKLWSGGTTTQLYIFPLTADYKERNFKFRLSTATVETNKSDFTLLNGISRKLMVLTGEITISHEGHYTKQLNKFDVDYFDGGWKTSSIGKCTDLNLMTAGKTTGELTAIFIEKEQHINWKIKENCDWLFIYPYSGKIRIEINRIITIISKGDLLILRNPAIRSLEITGNEYSELVFTEIKA